MRGYKATINTVLNPDKYPLPTFDDLFVKLSGGVIFSKLDLYQTFTQLRVDEESSKVLKINTIKGLFTVYRLPFGINAAPGMFQRLMEGLLADILGVAILIDDIVVTKSTIPEHDERVKEVLDRVHKYGLKLKRSKCVIGVPEVVFLGFRINKDGIHPLQQKIDATEDAPSPTNKSELQVLLGIINFYDRFLPCRATKFECLYRFLDKNSTWEWTKEHEEAV